MVQYIPFFNAFILYICLVKGQLFNKPYTWLLENVFVYLPSFIIKILGGCIICTSMWMGIIEIFFCLGFNSEYSPQNIILLLVYNATSTTLIYKFLHD